VVMQMGMGVAAVAMGIAFIVVKMGMTVIVVAMSVSLIVPKMGMDVIAAGVRMATGGHAHPDLELPGVRLGSATALGTHHATSSSLIDTGLPLRGFS